MLHSGSLPIVGLATALGHGAPIACMHVQWSEGMIKADPFFGRSRVRFRVLPWVSNTIARDHLA